MPGEQPPVCRQIAAIAPFTAMRGGEAAAAARMGGRFPAREWRGALPVLIRHARSGVPRPWRRHNDVAAKKIAPGIRHPCPHAYSGE